MSEHTGRSLRPRKEGQSFAEMFQLPESDEDMGGESGSGGEDGALRRKKLPPIEEPVSDSEYDPGEGKAESEGPSSSSLSEDVSSETDEGHSDAFLDDGDGSVADVGPPSPSGVILRTARPVKRPRPGKSTTKFGGQELVASFNFTQKRPGNRTIAANPVIGSSRARATHLYTFPGPSRRLSTKPSPFEEPQFVSTKAHAGSVAARVAKAWSFSVFPGPVWELLEDMAYFKEVVHTATGERRRPIVHSDVYVHSEGFEILDSLTALPYLPFDAATHEDGSCIPAPPIDCLFGPFGAQVEDRIQPFGVLKLSKYFPKSASIVLNAGGAVWGLDWCPVTEDALISRAYVQYLAVAPFPSAMYTPFISSRLSRPSFACIQIWAYGPGIIHASQSPNRPRLPKQARSKPSHSPDVGDAVVTCPMVLCVDGGPAHSVKWCPLPSHGPIDIRRGIGTPRLGILAGIFGDGTASIYVVPDPGVVQDSLKTPDGQTIYLHMKEPLVRIETSDAACTCLDWANSERLAVGCSNGNVLVYDIKDALRNPQAARDLLPLNCISVAQVAIRSVVWIRSPPYSHEGKVNLEGDPTIFCATSYEGSMYTTDMREPCGHAVFRARDVAYDIASGPYIGGALAVEHENVLKAFSMRADALGRGHTVSETGGPVWSISTSDYHPYIATAAADGACMTVNLLKPLRRGGLVPIFIHKLYQMDYNRNTKQYRMLQNFIPLELSEGKKREKLSAEAKAKTREDSMKPYSELDPDAQRAARSRESSGAWPKEVGVHRVVWNTGSGYNCAPLLASGMACGLVRIDWLEGRFHAGRTPYQDIESLRHETAGLNAMDIDEKDD